MKTNAHDKIGELPSLTGREAKILRLAADGLVDKEIARELGLSSTTVRTHWQRLRTKLKAANRAHAVALGMPHNRMELAAEEINAFIVRNISEPAIFCCDEQGVILTWNKGVGTLFGYTEKEWVGQHASIFFVPEEKPDATRELADAARVGTSVNDRWHVRSTGARFWGTNTVLALPTPQVLGAYVKIVREKAAPE